MAKEKRMYLLAEEAKNVLEHNPNYDMTTQEATELYKLAQNGVDGIYKAIITAFSFGFEQGRESAADKLLQLCNE